MLNNKDYILLKVMNGRKISPHWLCRDLILPFGGTTDLNYPIYVVYEELIKKEKIIELLLDINKINLYMRRMKINKLLNQKEINVKLNIQLNLLSFMLENFNSLTCVEERHNDEYYEHFYY